MIGLWLERQNGDDLKRSGFDGVYTYFASEGFSYGSSVHNWLRICNYCRANEMLCVLSAGPGYNDTKIRPWNHANTMSRRDGSYYREMLEGALAANPHVVSGGASAAYLTYGRNPFVYLEITAEYARKFRGEFHEGPGTNQEREL
eukprot:gene79-79_t